MASSCQRVKRHYPCVFEDQNCDFMGGKAGFKNCAELKEDALRHLKAYQCTNCGRCFGKKYGLARHVNKSKYPCTKRIFSPGFSELLLQDLEGAKGYKEIQAVANRCAPYRNLDVKRARKRQQQGRRNGRSDYNHLQEQTIVDPTLLDINYDAVSPSPIDSTPPVAIPGNGNSGVGLLLVSDNPHASHSGPYWDVSSISDIVPISGLLAGGTTQAHYNSPPLPWNNNILPGITFSLENVNTRITFPQPTTSSISDITPSTVTTAEHNPEGATIDLFAQPFNFVGDTQAAESDLLPLTKHYVEHRPGDPPASEPTFMEDINSCRNTFPGLSEEESGNTLPWWLLHEEPNNTFLNGSTS